MRQTAPEDLAVLREIRDLLRAQSRPRAQPSGSRSRRTDGLRFASVAVVRRPLGQVPLEGVGGVGALAPAVVLVVGAAGGQHRLVGGLAHAAGPRRVGRGDRLGRARPLTAQRGGE